jgi:fumarate hydratase class II
MHFQYVNNCFNTIFFMFIFLVMNIAIILELNNRLYSSLDLLQKALKQKSEHYNGYVNQITTNF